MKNLLYLIENQGANWELIWTDISIYVCVMLAANIIFVIYAAKNYKNNLREHYLVKTTSRLCALNCEIDRLTSENKFLHESFTDYKKDVEIRINNLAEENKKLSASVRKKDEKGHYLPISGKGHVGKDWTKATNEQLLNEAKRRYKIGSIVLCVLVGDEVKLTSKDFEITENKELLGKGEKTNVFLYNNGFWAKKIKYFNHEISRTR